MLTWKEYSIIGFVILCTDLCVSRIVENFNIFDNHVAISIFSFILQEFVAPHCEKMQND